MFYTSANTSEMKRDIVMLTIENGMCIVE